MKYCENFFPFFVAISKSTIQCFPASFMSFGFRKNHPSLLNLIAITGVSPNICENIMNLLICSFVMYLIGFLLDFASMQYFFPFFPAIMSQSAFSIVPLPAVLTAL